MATRVNRCDFSIKITINRKTLDTNEFAIARLPQRDYRSNLKNIDIIQLFNREEKFNAHR